MTAPTWVASAIANSGISATTANVPFLMPAATVAGQLAVVGITTAVDSLTMTTTPAGWNLITPTSGTNPFTQGTSLMLFLYYKILDTETAFASRQWVLSTATRPVGTMELWSGFNTTTPIDGCVVTGAGSAVSQAAPAITTTRADVAVLNLWTARQGTGGPSTITVPGTHTARGYSATSFATGAVNNAIRAGQLTSPGAAGSYGTYTATYGAAGVAGLASIGIRPATSPTAFFSMVA